jgi:hypothetical protein
MSRHTIANRYKEPKIGYLKIYRFYSARSEEEMVRLRFNYIKKLFKYIMQEKRNRLHESNINLLLGNKDYNMATLRLNIVNNNIENAKERREYNNYWSYHCIKRFIIFPCPISKKIYIF